MKDNTPSLNLRSKLLKSLNPPTEHATWCKGSHLNDYVWQLEQAEIQASEIVKRDPRLRIRKNKRNSSMWKGRKQDNNGKEQNQNLNTSNLVEYNAEGQAIEQAADGQKLLTHEKTTRRQHFVSERRTDSPERKGKNTYAASTKKCQHQSQLTVCELLQNSYTKMKNDDMPAFAFPPLLTPFKRSFFRYYEEKNRPLTHISGEVDPVYGNSRKVPPTRDTLDRGKNVFPCADRKAIDDPFQGQVNGPPAFVSSWATRAHRFF